MFVVAIGQRARWIKMPLGTMVGLGPGNIVLDADPALPKEHSPPHFATHVCCGQTAGCIKMPLGTEVGLSPGHIVLDEDPVPALKGAHPPLFGPCLCAIGQTARWIKMPLSMMVGLGPGNIVLDADPAPAKGHSPAPFCDPCLLRPNGWMDQDATWYEDRPRPRPHCVTRGPGCPQKGHSPQFSAHVYCG